MHLHRHFSNHSQNPLTTDAQAAYINAIGGIWDGSRLDRATRSHHPQSYHHILDLPVFIALHTRRPSSHPASQRGVHERIRKMPERHALLLKLFLHVRPIDSSLNTRNKGFFINAQHAIHSPHIQTHNKTTLTILRFQTARDIRPATKGDNHYVVLTGCFDDCHDIILAGGIHNQIRRIIDLTTAQT